MYLVDWSWHVPGGMFFLDVYFIWSIMMMRRAQIPWNLAHERTPCHGRIQHWFKGWGGGGHTCHEWYVFCMVFHVRWIFTTSMWTPPSRLRRGWDSETSGEKSISHGKPYKMHFLEYFTLQGMLIMLNTLRKVEDHETMWEGFISQLFSTWGKVRSMR